MVGAESSGDKPANLQLIVPDVERVIAQIVADGTIKLPLAQDSTRAMHDPFDPVDARNMRILASQRVVALHQFGKDRGQHLVAAGSSLQFSTIPATCASISRASASNCAGSCPLRIAGSLMLIASRIFVMPWRSGSPLAHFLPWFSSSAGVASA